MNSNIVSAIRGNLQRVNEQIMDSALKASRKPEDIRLVVVTKRQPLDLLQVVVDAGARDLGENYAEEAVGKMAALESPSDLKWHMIGHIQSRKAKIVCENFSLVHSVDSIKLAERLDFFTAAAGRILPVLLEFNLAGEASKTGWPADDESQWKKILPDIEQFNSLKHLSVQGLMTMPPLFNDPEDTRPFFKQLRKLQGYLQSCLPDMHWQELSMGTSSDFKIAIQEGATMVRIGQAILGPRI